jgi:hypothetical protein
MAPNERFSRSGLSFDPPAAWQNAQIVFYAAPIGGKPPPPSIVIASEPMAECESLRAFVNRKLTSFARTNPGLELRGCSAADVGGRSAMRLRLLRTQPGPIEQILVVVDTADDPERRATIFSLACVPEYADDAYEVFDALLASVRFESPVRVSGVPPPRTPVPPPALPEMGLLPVIPIPGCRRAL